MKIGIISHSPLWATGFGITCRQIAYSLIKVGHTVCCFSLGDDDGPKNGHPFKIYQVSWPRAYGELSAFFANEQPDVILINFDINAVRYFMNFCISLNWKNKIFAHLVIDGFPVYKDLLNAISRLDGIIVPTKTTKRYLQSEKVKNVYYAPHGVDRKKFIPLNNKENIRLKISPVGLLKKSFIIGVFAKNEERKQIPKILLALQYLVFDLKQKDILLYLHTQAKPDINRGWDLKYLVNYLKLNKYVLFPSGDFQQDKGIDRNIDLADEKKTLSYIERINMCDLIVNIPFSGGFELCNIEAQACGIPLITIDDGGNIKEVVGNSTFLIQPSIKNVWGNGAWIYLIDEKDLANKILQIKNDPEQLKSISERGVGNSKRFSWKPLGKIVNKMLTDNI